MKLIKVIINKYKEKRKLRNEACNNQVNLITAALEELDNMFLDNQEYIDSSKGEEWKNKNAKILNNTDIKKFRWAKQFKELLEVKEKLHYQVNFLSQRIIDHNNEVTTKKIQNASAIIGNVEGKELDKQQILCIIKESHNHLVIAGAGTGKTTTIVGKIKYLIKSGQYKPEDILVLSFTNASASEMRQRINQEIGHNIDALTFHKLGLNIIKDTTGSVPKITNLNLSKFIKEQLKENMKDEIYLKLLISYILYAHIVAKSEFEFRNQVEYEEYLKLNKPTTIKNEVVKSYGELDIANFLTQNGIKYTYECPYKIETQSSEYGQYKPDFYLPDYDIYIEYFGINKQGEVPAYFQGTHGMTATQAYQKTMEWKRKIHKENGTTMIECYAYEKVDGTLLDNLKKKLINMSVSLNLIPTKELWEQISKSNESVLDGMIELFETLINLTKSKGYTIEKIKELNTETINSNTWNNSVLLSLLEPVYNAYCSYLIKQNEIDFNDMINIATQYIEQKKYINHYKYVIVDEYQDISQSRFCLLTSMRRSNDYNLFCVGDDWQSIYRFTGSDINLILNFKDYWGPSEISKIENTYRFNQKLAEISSNFIMKNPAQLRKNIKSQSSETKCVLGEISGYNERYAAQFMAKKILDLPKNSTVFFIGRYSFDINLLYDSPLFECNYDNINNWTNITYSQRTDLKMHFITAHKSKGLQADFVFIINNKSTRMGFPSKIQDTPILNLLLDNYEHFPYAEERRLFYVALTRAKKKVFLVTIDRQKSEFVMELKAQYTSEINQERYECPICGGKLSKINGQYGAFLGCSNYKITGCAYKRKLDL